MTTLSFIPTYQLQRKYATLNNILESNSINGQSLTPDGRALVGNEMIVIAGILDNRSLITDAGQPEFEPVASYDETGNYNGFEPYLYPAQEEFADSLNMAEHYGLLPAA